MEMVDSGEIVFTRGRGIVVGYPLVRWPQTTPSEAIFSNTSTTAVGGVCIETRTWWGFDLPVTTNASLLASNESSREDRRLMVTTIIIELVGMLVSTGVMFYHQGTDPGRTVTQSCYAVIESPR